MARLGHWEEHRTILRGRVGVTVYRLKRPGIRLHPKAKHFRGSIGWVLSLDVHLGRWGVGFWPIAKGSRPGLRWVPDVAPPD